MRKGNVRHEHEFSRAKLWVCGCCGKELKAAQTDAGIICINVINTDVFTGISTLCGAHESMFVLQWEEGEFHSRINRLLDRDSEGNILPKHQHFNAKKRQKALEAFVRRIENLPTQKWQAEFLARSVAQAHRYADNSRVFTDEKGIEHEGFDAGKAELNSVLGRAESKPRSLKIAFEFEAESEGKKRRYVILESPRTPRSMWSKTSKEKGGATDGKFVQAITDGLRPMRRF